MRASLRDHLIRLLDWEEAHVGFEKVVHSVPPDRRGTRPAGFDHSLWQLVEHLRLAQKDLLDFIVNPKYMHALTWPDDYWPTDPVPPSVDAWDASLAAIRADQARLKTVIADEQVDLLALVPTGQGRQTVLRAILLVADHNAYHLGQMVQLRRALGIWG